MQVSTLLLVTIAIVVGARETRQAAPFKSIEVSGGAHVVLRNAPAHRVQLLRGSRDLSRIEVTRSGELIIEKCRSKCPKGYQLEVEVSAPSITSILVEHGGRIESRESFPRQAELILAVANGGSIDARSLPADRVTASVKQGGGILTAPRTALSATVANGGNVTYWGDPQVTSSVDHAGAVQKALR